MQANATKDERSCTTSSSGCLAELAGLLDPPQTASDQDVCETFFDDVEGLTQLGGSLRLLLLSHLNDLPVCGSPRAVLLTWSLGASHLSSLRCASSCRTSLSTPCHLRLLGPSLLDLSQRLHLPQCQLNRSTPRYSSKDGSMPPGREARTRRLPLFRS